MKRLGESISVRVASSPAERREVFRSRYEIYVEEMGWPSDYADHTNRLLEEPLDVSGDLWMAEAEGMLVGSLRVNLGLRGGLGYYNKIYGLSLLECPLEEVGVLSKFAVPRSKRNLSVALQLVRATHAAGVGMGIRYAMLDCEPRMVAFYQWMGFEVHRSSIVHPEYGPGVCMKMEVNRWADRWAGRFQAEAA